MGKTFLLDCTLRDGGYINDWRFGHDCINAIVNKLTQTGIEIIEMGFIRGKKYDPDVTLFPNIDSVKAAIGKKESSIMYVGMIDMNDPVPIDCLNYYDGSSLDGVRVIFKKEKLKDAYNYCRKIKELGYKLFVNFVSTDAYSDKEFIEGIELFNDLEPYCVAIVDTFGMIKRKHFKRLVAIADNNLTKNVALGFHAHNNLQQAFGNAETLVEMNLKRNVIIDACVFGMGRGAGNLNLELFAEYMNDNYETKYRIEPMLEIMDEHLSGFYHKKFWGYSLPLYISASLGCHPNYAIYYAEKNSLTEKAFYEIMQNMPNEDKRTFSTEKAEYYYRKYFENCIDDRETVNILKRGLCGKKVVLIAPGQSIIQYENEILSNIDSSTEVIMVNFYDEKWKPKYIFTSNIRRFAKLLENNVEDIMIATSNIPDCSKAKYVVDFSSYINGEKEVFANSGLMLLRLLAKLEVSEVLIAGMDGYRTTNSENYINENFETSHVLKTDNRNALISQELIQISRQVKIKFITPSKYLFE